MKNQKKLEEYKRLFLEILAKIRESGFSEEVKRNVLAAKIERSTHRLNDILGFVIVNPQSRNPHYSLPSQEIRDVLVAYLKEIVQSKGLWKLFEKKFSQEESLYNEFVAPELESRKKVRKEATAKPEEEFKTMKTNEFASPERLMEIRRQAGLPKKDPWKGYGL